MARSPADYASPLAKRPYHLRHAAAPLWLNAGVPATRVAAWAAHSVNVLLRVYASCIVSEPFRAVDSRTPPTQQEGPKLRFRSSEAFRERVADEVADEGFEPSCLPRRSNRPGHSIA